MNDAHERLDDETHDRLMDAVNALIFAARHRPEADVVTARTALMNCILSKAPVPPHAAGEEVTPTADRLYDAIERILTDHRLQHWYTEEDAGENFRLLDHLSSGETIESGRDEIRLICDAIYNDVLLKEFPAASQAAPETHEEWLTLRLRLAYLEGFRTSILHAAGMDQESE